MPLVATAQESKPPTNEYNVAIHEVKAWQRQAPEGDALAQYWLGKAFLNGWYLEPDPKAAFDWFTKSAEQGSEFGLNAVALCYQTGTGTDKNLAEAASILTKLSQSGHPFAQYNLGRSYLRGIGLAQDSNLAQTWLKKAAAQKNGDAMNLLSEVYRKGLGVEPDPKAAFQWLVQSAEQKNPMGHYLLGQAYELGMGTDPRTDKALEQYEKAANFGHPKAMLALSELYLRSKKDGLQSFYWLTEAAQAGEPQAEFLLGGTYYYGEGVQKDLDQAKRWFERAEKHGHPQAADFLQRIRERSRRP